ncbi:ROK family transcriptional regulator [Arthrobacter sp. ISL-72]|uniref:ROK family transcriptional regulator n=1 Tax=Arthrobacter sp. ISL-72 TaxID=2819114 RepID=UPI001BE6DBA5|nr:ROK family transcriptional regulator [Arthrobacter sp. ISL-72]MBT2594027.1 ROK family transcriptional regulator [Arthrobacter sp. ISL-72]
MTIDEARTAHVLTKHEASIVLLLRPGLELTITEISEALGVSRPTAANALSDLTDAGWVASLDAQSNDVALGRPARRYRFRREAGLVAGVDVGLHSLRVVLVDLNEKVVGSLKLPHPPGLGAAEQIDVIVDVIRRASSAATVSAPILAIGLGLPGVVDSMGRLTICSPRSEWEGIPFAHRLAQRFDCPVFGENDAMAAAKGENRFGTGRGASSFVYVLAGHRTSSATVLEGRLLRGFTGAAGMVGELPYLRWASAPSALSDSGGSSPDPLETFSRAAAGDRRAVIAVERYLDDLSVGLAAMCLAIDPELVILGGGITPAGQEVADSLREKVRKQAHLVGPRIEMSTLGENATVMGAACIAFEHAESQVLGLSGRTHD